MTLSKSLLSSRNDVMNEICGPPARDQGLNRRVFKMKSDSASLVSFGLVW